MALASLRFQRNAQDCEETRQGMTVFAGDAASFHEWQFRLQIKKSLCKAEELPALTAKVVDAHAVKPCHVPWKLDLPS